MITIEGLTARQKSIMELLWSCRDIEQVQTLIRSLPSVADQYDALSLVQIATWESIEEELGLEDCAEAAADIIAGLR